MFSSTSSFVSRTDTTVTLSAARRPRVRFTAVPSSDEAYDLQLLTGVARFADQAAFEEIYARHHAAVKRVAAGVCRDSNLADDIVQHTFAALWTRAAGLADKSVRLRPWLTTVARNAAIDQLRAERPTAPLEAAERMVSHEARPECAVLEHETHAELAAALTSLSADQRAAVELVYFASLTYHAAAAQLGEPVGTVKSRVRLALGHLRTLLA